ncbi:MAG: single-stranded DNA-binding protein [Coleofasciculus sp. Co-bin14]|nr:single-stranded DNA-binding protein [Coleofasciculus sp. Co-bin14]
MNSCILMAQIIQDPELRYTSENQTPVTQMLVQFPNQRSEDPPTTLKVVGWGNFAHEIKENYSAGDRVVIEGRLSMNTMERPEGFKEKRAELVASRIYKLGADTVFEPHTSVSSTTYDTPAPTASSKSNNVVVPMRSPRQSAPMREPEELDRDYAASTPEPTFEPATARRSPSANLENQQDLDDIPF